MKKVVFGVIFLLFSSFCARVSGAFSFFFCPNKRKTKQKENSPSAFFCLLRYFFPLKKKNSLRSNSFFFLTLQKAPTLHGKKKRPDLDVFWGGEETTSLRSLEWFFFIFLLPEQKKNETKRKFAVCIFLPTPVFFSAKEKELAPLKQLFLFNAPKSTYASRQKKEAGP